MSTLEGRVQESINLMSWSVNNCITQAQEHIRKGELIKAIAELQAASRFKSMETALEEVLEP